MAKASRVMNGNSMAGKILAMGIVDQGDPVQLEAAYQRMNHQAGKQMIAVGISKKFSAFKAMRFLGGEYFKLSKMQAAAEVNKKEARQRYHWVLLNILGEDPDPKPQFQSAKEALTNQLKQ